MRHNLDLSDDVSKALQKKCKHTDKSLNAIVVSILHDWLEEKDEIQFAKIRTKKIEKDIQKPDGGCMEDISLKDLKLYIDKWIDTYGEDTRIEADSGPENILWTLIQSHEQQF